MKLHWLIVTLSGLLIGGCSTTPRYDARFGDAVREAKLAMVLRPGPVSTDPVLGIDGSAARESILRYQNSFKTPPPVVNVINIGNTSNQAK